ncbi:MAG: hypothetical protein FWF52_10475 [Candidatus Azobacteroides sp.]|nr:hypothetical protein [Candidatus Azobacteroides sp.]
MRYLKRQMQIIAIGIFVSAAIGTNFTSCVVDEGGGNGTNGQTNPARQPLNPLNPQVVRISGFDGKVRDIDIPANPVLRFPVADIIKAQAGVLGINFSDEAILIGLSGYMNGIKTQRDLYLNMYNLQYKQDGGYITAINYAFEEDINIYAGLQREIVVSSFGRSGIMVEKWLHDTYRDRLEVETDDNNLSLTRIYDTQANQVNIFDRNEQFIGYLIQGIEPNTIIESQFERDNRGMVIYNEEGNVIENKSLISNVQIKTIARPKDNPKPNP